MLAVGARSETTSAFKVFGVCHERSVCWPELTIASHFNAHEQGQQLARPYGAGTLSRNDDLNLECVGAQRLDRFHNTGNRGSNGGEVIGIEGGIKIGDRIKCAMTKLHANFIRRNSPCTVLPSRRPST
jgi:hypothetical protein